MTTAETGQTTELGYNIAGGYNVTGWSPDGKWLVMTKRDADQNADVFLFEVDTKRELNVTQNPWTDTQGTITPDGTTRGLRLRSQRRREPAVRRSRWRGSPKIPNDPLVRERQRRAQGSRGGAAAGAAAGEPGATAGQAAAADAAGRISRRRR